MKITLEITEESIQKHLDEHIHQLLSREVMQFAAKELHQVVLDSVRGMAAGELASAVMPPHSEIRQMVAQEIRRMARQIIGKAMTE